MHLHVGNAKKKVMYMDYTCHVYGYIYLHAQHQLTPTYF